LGSEEPVWAGCVLASQVKSATGIAAVNATTPVAEGDDSVLHVFGRFLEDELVVSIEAVHVA